MINPARIYLAGLQSEGSRRVQRTALATVAAVAAGKAVDPEKFDWHLLRRPDMLRIKAELAKKYAPATVNRYLTALRMTLAEAKRLRHGSGERLISLEDYTDVVDVRGVTRHALPAGREVTRDELAALFVACVRNFDPVRGSRDAAIVALIYGGGLRRSEACKLTFEDWDPSDGSVAIRHGKGDKDRIVFLPEKTIEAMAAWIAVRGTGPGPLFRVKTAEGIREILKNVAAVAGVRGFSPHDLRRSYISHMIEAGADLSAIKDQAGHASVQTTIGYDRRGERAKKAAAKLLCVPYLGR